jgi:hypothetical protein
MKRRNTQAEDGDEQARKRQALVSIAASSETRMRELIREPIIPFYIIEETNPLLNSFSEDDIQRLCVFTKSEIIDLFHYLGPSYAKFHTRGRKAHFSRVDSLVVFLIFMSCGTSTTKISAILTISTDTLHATLERAATILYDGCVGPWLRDPPKPVLSPTFANNVRILVDSTYVPVPRILDDFEVGKTLWDEHHKVYALKKQICVQAGHLSSQYTLLNVKLDQRQTLRYLKKQQKK